MKRLILASASPRRKELLEKAGYDFEIVPADVEEVSDESMSVTDVTMCNAKLKARDVSSKNIGAVVLGCDTVVFVDGMLLGKPKDEEDAFKMLKNLSGRDHTVSSGVCITDGKTEKSFVVSTKVRFYELSDETILDYIKTGEPMDKAGAYAIQEIGSMLVKKIDGDYFSVMGLPISRCARILKDFGIEGSLKLD